MLNNMNQNNYVQLWLLQQIFNLISISDWDYSKSPNMPPELKSMSILSVVGRSSSILRDLLFPDLWACSEQLSFGVASDVRLKCISYLLSPACLPSFKDFWYNATKCFGARQSLAKCKKSPHLWHLLSFLDLALSLFHLCELGF